MIFSTQKEGMVMANLYAFGDKHDTIGIYAIMDEEGFVPRKSDITPRDSKDYATILWHTAKKLEWI